MLRVHLCPADSSAVGHYRIRQPVAALEAAGEPVRCEIAPGLPMMLDVRTARATGLLPEFNTDVLVLQRPMAYWHVLAARDARERGIAVVVELDDDFHSLDSRNLVWWQIHPRRSPDWNVQHLSACCKLAHLITCTTPVLAGRYAPRGNSMIIPNFVPCAWTEIRAETDEGVIGWTGTVATHRDDLQATGGAVESVLRDVPGARMRTIGVNEKDLDVARRNLGLSGPVESVPWLEIERYPVEIARFDVAIAPLADTRFNSAKSALKPMEAAALGVPVVMSPVADYRRLHDMFGIGVLAGWRAREWRRELRRLLTDRHWREECSVRGRAAARDHLTIESNAWRWADAWQHAADMARVAPAPTGAPVPAAGTPVLMEDAR